MHVIIKNLSWGGAAALLFAASAVAAPTAKPESAAKPEPPFVLQEVGRGVWAAIAEPHSVAGSNAGFVIGADGVLVVDSFEVPSAARALLAAIREKTSLPVRYLVNTHYHLDHVAGNGVFQEAGAVLLAQRNVRTWERSENLKFFGDKITAEQRHMVQSYVLPTLVYRDSIEVYLGDRKVLVTVMYGHTGGDSVVTVPDADVTFTGDLFWNHSLPNLIDADTVEQIATNRQFVAVHPAGRFVPGHGKVATAADVAAFSEYLVDLRAAVASARAAGKTDAAAVEMVGARLKPTYGTWGYFDYFLRPNIEQTLAEEAGTKRRPSPAT